MRIIIAEDERLAREELIYMLSRVPDVTLLPSTINGKELLGMIEMHEPDVVFLDIEMPEMNGMEAARQLQTFKHPPYVVFTTAYSDFAVEAFRVGAIDYLLKPFDETMLSQTLDRVRQTLKKQIEFEITPFKKEKINKLLIDDGSKLTVVDPETVLYAVKEEKHTKICLSRQECIMTKYTLSDLETQLQGYPFFRSHRSYLVNLNHIYEIEPWFNGAYNIIINDESRTKIPVSRTSAKELLKRLKGES
jgi:two-component system response regulator LytT